MTDRLAEIEKVPIPEYVNIDAKVVFKPHPNLNLEELSPALKIKMTDMPLSTKIKAITSSLFPTAQVLRKDLSFKEKSVESSVKKPPTPVLIPTMTQ